MIRVFLTRNVFINRLLYQIPNLGTKEVSQTLNLFGACQMPDYLFLHSKALSLSSSQIIFTSIGSCAANWFAQQIPTVAAGVTKTTNTVKRECQSLKSTQLITAGCLEIRSWVSCSFLIKCLVKIQKALVLLETVKSNILVEIRSHTLSISLCKNTFNY